MFDKLLIANRGEIACRIARTARRLGIRTVAVYSDADASAAHVAACDEAVPIGGARPQESYLRGEVILEAARRTGAQACIPAMASCPRTRASPRACAAAGVVFVGPSPEAIAAMGSKSAAKALMERAGVPLTPGYHGDRQEDDYLLEQARPHRVPRAHQGGVGRRRQGHAARRRGPRISAAALASCRARGAGEFRRRARAGGEIRHARPAHRGAGVRRRPRWRSPSIRTRLLGAAPPPEGDGGSAGTGDDAGTPPPHGRGGRGRGARRELRRRGHRGVHRRCRRRVLLHGDEHAPAGGACRDRNDHRSRPGGVAAAHGRGRAAAVATGGTCRSTGMPSRRASTRRIRRAIFCRPSAGSSTWSTPAERARICASTPACGRATRSRRTTTR